jgi:hypothetical protein
MPEDIFCNLFLANAKLYDHSFTGTMKTKRVANIHEQGVRGYGYFGYRCDCGG